MNKRVLLTGAEGYIGSVLGPMLLERGHEVTGLDTGFFRVAWLYDPGPLRIPALISQDTRRVEERDLRDFDAVIHLAELSNDPLGELKPEITYEINHRGSVAFAGACKDAGIERFVYSSSCSAYGLGADGFRTEASETQPQTAYARCKLLVEEHLHALADADFSPVILRNATAYGASPRMRFDLVVNNLGGVAWTTGVIKMTSDGTPGRPLVHVRDIAEAFACALEAPREVVHDETFNVGHTDHNYQIREVAEVIADVFPRCELSFGRSDGDNRSYRVCFDKIHERLPGFRCRWTPREGAEELRRVFETIGLDPETFERRRYTRLRQLRHLLEAGRLDDHFFWRCP